jgi:hypothetical protein
MFSKLNTNNFFFNKNNFNDLYNKLSFYFSNNNVLFDSYNYGLKKQQNYLNSISILNNNVSFLNFKSLNKILMFNYKTNVENIFSIFKKFNINNYLSTNNNNIFFLKNNNYFLNNNYKTNVQLNNFITYNFTTKLINLNSDKKKILFPIYKQFNNFFKNKNDFFLVNTLNKLTLPFDSFFFKKSNSLIISKLNNVNKNNYNFYLSSTNQNISLSNRNVRNFINLKKNVPMLNHSSLINSFNVYDENEFNVNNLNFFTLNVLK